MLDAFNELYTIIKTLRSPGGCPWDREQNPMSMRSNLLEETLECIDAIEENDQDHIREELGDIYLLVTMLGYMFEEKNAFTITDILSEINEKLRRRHPHVFGESSADTPEAVLKQWEHIKQNVEKKNQGSYLMDAIPRGLHPLERAFKIQKKAAKYGFDWNETAPIFEKIDSEIEETREAMKLNDQNEVEHELGDLLFSVINLCRFLDVDPALALHKSNNKFIRRFSYIEDKMNAANMTLSGENLKIMDSYWEEAKNETTSG